MKTFKRVAHGIHTVFNRASKDTHRYFNEESYTAGNIAAKLWCSKIAVRNPIVNSVLMARFLTEKGIVVNGRLRLGKTA